MFRKTKIILGAALLVTMTGILAGCSLFDRPVTTFKINDRTVEVYNMNNFKLTKENATIHRITASKGKVYAAVTMKKDGVIENAKANDRIVVVMNVKDNSVKDTINIGSWNVGTLWRHFYAANNGVMWAAIENTNTKSFEYNFYDGKNTQTGIKAPITNGSYAIRKGTMNVYYYANGTLMGCDFDGKNFTNVQDVMSGEDFWNAIRLTKHGVPFGADERNVYLQSKRKDNENYVLYALSYEGNRTFTLEADSERAHDWAITAYHIIYGTKSGKIIVYDKNNGTKLSESKLDDLELNHLAAAEPNEVYVFDEKRDNLLRMDL